MSTANPFADIQFRFRSVSKSLRKPRYSDHCETALAHWISINDRGLPFALLEKSVAQIIADGFEAAASVRGIGLKKLHGLVAILERVAAEKNVAPIAARNSDLPSRPVFASSAASLRQAARETIPIREVDWDAWRTKVAGQGIARDPIGRYVDSLRTLPRRDWSMTLEVYAACSLNQLFGLRRYGSHRAAAVVETFQRLSESKPPQVAGRPKMIQSFVNALSTAMRSRRGAPTEADWARFFRQIRHDFGLGTTHVCTALLESGDSPTIHTMSAARLWYYRKLLNEFILLRCPEIGDLAWTILCRSQQGAEESLAKLNRISSLLRSFGPSNVERLHWING